MAHGLGQPVVDADPPRDTNDILPQWRRELTGVVRKEIRGERLLIS